MKLRFKQKKVKIIKAKTIDCKDLTELTIRSKSYWNYGKEQIEAWIDELTITENYIDENEVYKFVNDNVLIGFYAYAPKDQMQVKLNYLFVDSDFIGQGYGKLLTFDFLKRIEASGFQRVILDADPNAEKFYLKLGFRVIGKLKSSIKNRFLPIMMKEITSIAKHGSR